MPVLFVHWEKLGKRKENILKRNRFAFTENGMQSNWNRQMKKWHFLKVPKTLPSQYRPGQFMSLKKSSGHPINSVGLQ